MVTTLKLSLRQLELFCAAADHGSFAAAAHAIFLTPNAVALAVKELETALDTHLCVRHPRRGITLTPAGLHVLERARRLLRDAEELQRSLASGGPPSGPVALGCYSTLAPTVLPALIDGMAHTYPEIELTVRDGTIAELVPLLESGELDALIAYRFSLPESLEHLVLYETAIHVLISAQHRLADAPTVSLSDLSDEPLVLLDLPPSGSHTLTTLSMAGVTPHVAYRTPNFELVRSLVARGLGYSLLIQKPNIEESYEGLQLVAKRILPQFSTEAVVIAWPGAIRITDRARTLVDFARDTVPALQWTPRDGH